MNILILAASPRTGSTYFQNTVIPQKYFENFSYTPEGRDKMWLSSPPEMPYPIHISPYGEIHLMGERWAYPSTDLIKIVEHSDEPDTKRFFRKVLEDRYLDDKQMIAEWKWWYKTDSKNTIRVVKAFPSHFVQKGLTDISELLKHTHKVYLLFRKDYTAVVYSQLAAYKTNNYGPDRKKETINISKKEFDQMAEHTFSNYRDALGFVSGWHGDVEVVCLEEDLPHQPYKNNYTFNNPQFEVDREFKKFYNEFRRLGLPFAVTKRFDK